LQQLPSTHLVGENQGQKPWQSAGFAGFPPLFPELPVDRDYGLSIADFRLSATGNCRFCG
jgi:hypothetical protein